jgi:hypothetical protein
MFSLVGAEGVAGDAMEAATPSAASFTRGLFG